MSNVSVVEVTVRRRTAAELKCKRFKHTFTEAQILAARAAAAEGEKWTDDHTFLESDVAQAHGLAACQYVKRADNDLYPIPHYRRNKFGTYRWFLTFESGPRTNDYSKK